MAYHQITYQFKATLTGSYRSFSKDNQTITVRLSSSAKTGGRSENFTVLLQRRVAGVGYKTEGTAAFPRNGLKEVKFSDLPSGSYRLKFEKSTDDIEVIGVGVFHN
ncbi:hypothetical protein [Alkalihalophilus marmarensis]|uniref:hypothetical protein n=1 Tax=Alkalihalophilus marmarensis TaxID=521377 RepID=UPI002DBD33DA|nr:hypothetical protein [Alkalihalophilus marmarensis]MEC2074438.1 hypothetical protein [Alkalihalophilus marmarensis]